MIIWYYPVLVCNISNDYMWHTLPKPAIYAHYGKEQFSSPISINKLTNYQYTSAKLMGLLLLRLVSEACQTSMSAQVSIECHWLACTGNHLAGNHHTNSFFINITSIYIGVEGGG